MQRHAVAVAAVAALLLCAHAAPAAAQQMMLSPLRERGQTVQPVFEGWYRNPDGTYSLSFGYYNRNTEEILEIPVGAANFIQPAQFNGAQPATFQPQRHWGVFTVRVPANFGDEQRVWWHLVVRGDTLKVPGSLKKGWEIDALAGEAGSGNTPPKLRIGDAEGAGPGGPMGAPLTVAVGKPLTLTIWADDDGRARTATATTAARSPVTLAWFKHQGPGTVTFEAPAPRVDVTTKLATTTATFSEPGEYVLRVRANDGAVASAGHAQCCWSNGFVKVTVTR